MVIRYKLHEGATAPIIRNGNMCDLGVARIAHINNDKAISIKDIAWVFASDFDVIKVKAGEVLAIDTGVAMELPEGWLSYAVPRSSTFLKFGLILTNSIGVIDNSYKGDNDTWKGFFLCTRDCEIPVDTKLLQFQPVSDTIHQFNMVEVNSLGNEDRGGFGSTDENVDYIKELADLESEEPVTARLDLFKVQLYYEDLDGFDFLKKDVEEIIEFYKKYGYIEVLEVNSNIHDTQRYIIGFTKSNGDLVWMWAFNDWIRNIKE